LGGTLKKKVKRGRHRRRGDRRGQPPWAKKGVKGGRENRLSDVPTKNKARKPAMAPRRGRGVGGKKKKKKNQLAGEKKRWVKTTPNSSHAKPRKKIENTGIGNLPKTGRTPPGITDEGPEGYTRVKAGRGEKKT